MSSNCPKGQIERIGYKYTKKTSKKTIRVNPICIKDKGKEGKGPKLIQMPKEDEGLLSQYGYNLKHSYEDRIKILKKAFKNENPLKILRHLNALRTLHKSNILYYNKLNKDVIWIQEYYKQNKKKNKLI